MYKDFIQLINETANDEALFDVIDLTEEDGSLKGVPPGLKKNITGFKREGRIDSAYFNTPIKGGENSSREESEPAKSVANLRSHISKAMAGDKMVLIHKNGKPIAAVSGSVVGSKGARDEFTVHGPDTSDINYKSDYVHSRYNRGYNSGYNRSVVDPRHTKGSAIDAVMAHVSKHINSEEPEKEHFKHNKYHLVTIGPDEKRAALRAKRYDDSYDKKTSLDRIEASAAKKIAERKLGDMNSPYAMARDIHQKLGDAIKSGDRDAAKKHTKALADHFNSFRPLSKESDRVEKYASTLMDLKHNLKHSGNSWLAQYRKQELADMRNESITEALSYLSENQLDTIADAVLTLLEKKK